ncbi:hypothetical protein C5C31_07935 [Rathayibacter rathayi]|nr:hypothetical protein C5C31_07935 [Rathayibacter rathayi]
MATLLNGFDSRILRCDRSAQVLDVQPLDNSTTDDRRRIQDQLHCVYRFANPIRCGSTFPFYTICTPCGRRCLRCVAQRRATQAQSIIGHTSVRDSLWSFGTSAGPTTSVERLTIEHFLPQKELRNEMPFEVVGSLGNLLLVNDALNIRLGDKDFESKKRILQSDGLNYDSGGVLDAAEWTKDSIVARTCLLAERA